VLLSAYYVNCLIIVNIIRLIKWMKDSEKEQSDNLPIIDGLMVARYLSTNSDLTNNVFVGSTETQRSFPKAATTK
jgi:hypothetical protein